MATGLILADWGLFIKNVFLIEGVGSWKRK